MRISLAVLCLLSIVPALWSAPVPKTKPPEVELHPLATDLFVGEQFEAFVRFTNRGEEEVFLFRDWVMNQHYGNVTLEVKGPKEKEFRCPYTVQYPISSSHGTRPPRERGVKTGGTRCDFVALPFEVEDTSKVLFPVLDTAGEWQVRAKVIFLGKEEEVSSPVVVKVSERSDAEAKRFADTLAALRRPRVSKDSFGAEFKARLKLVEDLGACYTADCRRRGMLGFRLDVAGTEDSKETAVDVMKDIDAYLKTVPGPVRDRFCWDLADGAYRMVANDVGSGAFERGTRNPQDLALGRKYLKLVDCIPDSQEGMDEAFDELERKLNAKSPDAKDTSKPEKK